MSNRTAVVHFTVDMAVEEPRILAVAHVLEDEFAELSPYERIVISWMQTAPPGMQFDSVVVFISVSMDCELSGAMDAFDAFMENAINGSNPADSAHLN